jgi:hypothetical protein
MLASRWWPGLVAPIVLTLAACATARGAPRNAVTAHDDATPACVPLDKIHAVHVRFAGVHREYTIRVPREELPLNDRRYSIVCGEDMPCYRPPPVPQANVDQVCAGLYWRSSFDRIAVIIDKID